MLEWRDVWVKGSFFLPFRIRGRHNKSVLWTSFSVKEGVKPEKRGFQPMRKKLGEKFGVVFSLTVVVTDTKLRLHPLFYRERSPQLHQLLLPKATRERKRL